jgi:capsular exopolysaccharide synthesis family protein
MQRSVPDHSSPATVTTAVITRIHRYKALLLRRWWVVLLTMCLGLFIGAWISYQAPDTFLSTSKMMVAGKLNLSQNAIYSEDADNFYGTQIQLIKSEQVRSAAEAQVAAVRPELQRVKVELDVTQRPRTSIFELEATGPSPEYLQAYLNAVMQKYLEVKKGMRQDEGSHLTSAITEQLVQVEMDLRKGEDEMLEFQKENNVGLLQGEGNSAAAYLVKLNQQYASLKTEYDLLNLLDVDQNLERQEATAFKSSENGQDSVESEAMPFADFGPEGEYLKARQTVQLLKARRDALSKDLRPKHPKIIKLNDEIDQQEKLIALYRQDAVDKLDTRRNSIGKQMENLKANIAEWEKKALDLSQRLAQFNRIKDKVDRQKKLYDRLTNNLKDVNVSQVVNPGDQIGIMESATKPVSVRPGLVKSLLIGLGFGAFAGFVILILLDRIDDRMTSLTEFQHYFTENILGQIPKEKAKGALALLQEDDPRHVFAESYRNVRSSIFFMPYHGPRPKTFLITSALPNEGKSTVSSNLAITLALSGAKTLLVDGDLRRGSLREAFDIPSRRGFSEVLKQEVNWREVVVPTSLQSLFVLPRGNNLSQPSEHLLRESTDSFLKDIYNHFDYVIIDSSPVLAADDTTSLAPKIDATLMVVRLAYTSARLTKKALDSLYHRQVNVPGVILNFVDTSLPEYYYYQYAAYYNTPASAPKTWPPTEERQEHRV